MNRLFNEVRTHRILIRCPEIQDTSDVFLAKKRSVQSLKTWMDWAQNPPSLNADEQFIQEAIALNGQENPGSLPLFMFEKDSGTFIGSSGFVSIDWAVRSFEIGYWIDTRFEKQGFVTEAVHALCWFAFKQFNANRVQITCDHKNEASRKIPERISFSLEGQLKNHRITPGTGKVSDTLIFGLTDPDKLSKPDGYVSSFGEQSD